MTSTLAMGKFSFVRNLFTPLLFLIVSQFSFTAHASIECGGGVSDDASSKTLICNDGNQDPVSSITVDGGIISSLNNATAVEVFTGGSFDVFEFDSLTDGLCYEFTSTASSNSGDKYHGTYIAATDWFGDTGVGACGTSGGDSGDFCTEFPDDPSCTDTGGGDDEYCSFFPDDPLCDDTGIGGGGDVPPAPTITSPANNSVTSETTISISGSYQFSGYGINVLKDSKLAGTLGAFDNEDIYQTTELNWDGTNWSASGIQLDVNQSNTFFVTANVPDGASSTEYDTITITHDNTAPIGYTAAFNVAEVNGSNEIDVGFTISGAEIGATYQYTITDELAGSISGNGTISNATEALFANLSSLSDGQLTLSLVLTDEALNVGNAATVTVVKKASNAAPVISGTPTTSVDELTSYSFTPTVTDEDSTLFTYSINIDLADLWLTFDTTTGTLSGTPEQGDDGVIENIIISVSDGETSVSLDAFAITVNDVTPVDIKKGYITTFDRTSAVFELEIAESANVYYAIAKGYQEQTQFPTAEEVKSGELGEQDILIGSGSIELAGNVTKSLTFSSLEPGTLYYIYVVTEDQNGRLSNVSIGSLFDITTWEGFSYFITTENQAPTFTSTHVTNATEYQFYEYILSASDAEGDDFVYQQCESGLPDWLTVAAYDIDEPYVAPEYTVSGLDSIDGYLVDIAENFQPGDKLTWDESLASSYGITGLYDSSKGSLVFSGTTTPGNWRGLIRTVKLTFADGDDTPRVINIMENAGALDGVLSLRINGLIHYYELVDQRMSWSAAKANAESKTFEGRQGYLVTLVTAEEQALLRTKVRADTWMGASDAETEGVWKWVTGPDAGLHFYNQTRAHSTSSNFFNVYNGSSSSDGIMGESVNSAFNQWHANEPNDYRSGEDYAHLYSSGVWNDYPNNASAMSIIEYGGLATDNVSGESITKVFTVQKGNGWRLAGTPTNSNASNGSSTGTYNVSVCAADPYGAGEQNFTLVVTDVNDAPQATSESFVVLENAEVGTTVGTVQTSDEENDVLSYAITAGNTAGHFVIDGSSGEISVNAELDAVQQSRYQLTVLVTDDDGATAQATITVSVTNQVDSPVAVDDAFTLNEDTATLLNVASNDTDKDNNLSANTVKITAQPSWGQAKVNINGSVTYTPYANAFGSDSFKYTVADATGLVSEEATVSLTITPVNDAPIANFRIFFGNEDQLISQPLTQLATEVDGDALTLTTGVVDVFGNSSSPQNGSVEQNGQSFDYTPNENFYGFDLFSYSVNDGQADSNVQWVWLVLAEINDVPDAQPDTATVLEDESVEINALANDTDDEALDPTTVVIITQPSNGQVSVATTGVVTYTPNENFFGEDEFEYSVKDTGLQTGTQSGSGVLPSLPTKVSIKVTGVNDAPVVADVALEITEDSITSPINVLVNAEDADNDELTVTVDSVSSGEAFVDEDQTIRYTPVANFNGQASISFTVNDGNDATDSGVVSITVTEVNDTPVGKLIISGSPSVGETLTVTSTLIDNDNTDGVIAALNYQWFVNDETISGATSDTYIVAAADQGKMLSVKASYIDETEVAESKTSESVLVYIDAPTVVSVYSGSNGSQSTLTVGGTSPVSSGVISVYDAAGQLLGESQVIDGQWSITVDADAGAEVTLKLTDDNGYVSETITVEDTVEPAFVDNYPKLLEGDRTSQTIAFSLSESATVVVYAFGLTPEVVIPEITGLESLAEFFSMDGVTLVVNESTPNTEGTMYYDKASADEVTLEPLLPDNRYVAIIIAFDENNNWAPVQTLEFYSSSNVAPEFSSQADMTALVGNMFIHKPMAADTEGDTVSLTLSDDTVLPDWLNWSIDNYYTFAGTGVRGNENGHVSVATLNSPQGITLDNDGNVLVTNFTNNNIRKINAKNGQVTTFAGNGSVGTANGHATEASFYTPIDLDVDSMGNVYVIDGNYPLVRKIDTNGQVTTFAGEGAANVTLNRLYGLAVDHNDNVYVLEQRDSIDLLKAPSIYKFSKDGEATILASSSEFSDSGLDVDSQGNVFVATTTSILKVDPQGTITTFAGSEQHGFADGTGSNAAFSYPKGLVVDKHDNVLVADTYNDRIRKITPAGEVTTIFGDDASHAEGSSLGDSSIERPVGITVDDEGNIYLTDTKNHQIKVLSFGPHLHGTPTVVGEIDEVSFVAQDEFGAVTEQTISIESVDAISGGQLSFNETSINRDNANSFELSVSNLDDNKVVKYTYVITDGTTTLTGEWSGQATSTVDLSSLQDGNIKIEITASGAYGDEVSFVETITKSSNSAPSAIVTSLSFDIAATGTYVINLDDIVIDNDGDNMSFTFARATLSDSVTVNDSNITLALTTDAATEIHYGVEDEFGARFTGKLVVTIAYDEPPVISGVSDIAMSASKVLTPWKDIYASMTTKPTATDVNGDSISVVPIVTKEAYRSGRHQIVWQAVDSAGQKSTLVQTIDIYPYLVFNPSQKLAVRGNKVVTFELSGTVPSAGNSEGESEIKPVIDFNVESRLQGPDSSGSGMMSILPLAQKFPLPSTTAEFNGNKSEVKFSNLNALTSDALEGLIETYSYQPQLKFYKDGTLLFENDAQVLTLHTEYKAFKPTVNLSASQGGVTKTTVSKAGGNVVITAAASDPNGDSMNYQWTVNGETIAHEDSTESLEQNRKGLDLTQVSLDVSDLTSGIYTIQVKATDNSSDNLSATNKIVIKLIDAEIALSTETDSDNDGIPDSEEGAGDTDGDGIPDYQDAHSQANVTQLDAGSANSIVIESTPGVSLKRGATSFASDSGGIAVTGEAKESLVTDNEYETSVVFDFVASDLSEDGQVIDIVVPQESPIGANAKYRKYTAADGWVDFVIDDNNKVFSSKGAKGDCPAITDASWQEGLTQGHWCFKLQIEDGGPNDDDGEANGSITDPGTVAVLKTSNAAPVAVTDQLTLLWNTFATLDVLANDSDADSDVLTITDVSASFGDVEINSDQTLTYTPDENYSGDDVIVYMVSDGNGGLVAGEVAVTVRANFAPQVESDAATSDGSAVTIDVLANDLDADGDTMQVVEASASNGTVTINSDRTITYQPNNGFDGDDTITYTVSDGFESSTSTVTVSVDIPVIEPEESKKSSGLSVPTYLLYCLSLIALYRRVAKLRVIRK